MNVTVNGEEQLVQSTWTVRDLLEHLGLGATLVAVERNEEIVPRAEHTAVVLTAGDRLEIVHFVGGG